MKEIHPDHINITIPAYKEPDIISTLESVLACNRSGINLRIDVLINCSEEDEMSIKNFNQESFQIVQKYIEDHALQNYIFCKNISFPSKHAGVGLARKTLMDDAANRYRAQKINGIILALDADCYVQNNYLFAVHRFFKQGSFEAASLHFEHPVEDRIQDLPIIEYEWHLRYFVEMQKSCQFPFAFHTVGSSMACLSETYLSKGGMNKRKAGEDFYFMHKFIKDEQCGKLIETTVFPSGRVSDRVPFGTGRAVGKYDNQEYSASTYNPKSFEILKKWNLANQDLYENDELSDPKNIHLSNFLDSIDFKNKVLEIRSNVSSGPAFLKRFYQFFDAFQLMKCLHYMRIEFPDVSINVAREWFEKNMANSKSEGLFASLLFLRKQQSDLSNIQN